MKRFCAKGKAAVQKLLESGVAVQNEDGSVIVPLDEYGFDVPLLVQKSNGAALYATMISQQFCSVRKNSLLIKWFIQLVLSSNSIFHKFCNGEKTWH